MERQGELGVQICIYLYKYILCRLLVCLFVCFNPNPSKGLWIFKKFRFFKVYRNKIIHLANIFVIFDNLGRENVADRAAIQN